MNECIVSQVKQEKRSIIEMKMFPFLLHYFFLSSFTFYVQKEIFRLFIFDVLSKVKHTIYEEGLLGCLYVGMCVFFIILFSVTFTQYLASNSDVYMLLHVVHLMDGVFEHVWEWAKKTFGAFSFFLAFFFRTLKLNFFKRNFIFKKLWRGLFKKPELVVLL